MFKLLRDRRCFDGGGDSGGGLGGGDNSTDNSVASPGVDGLGFGQEAESAQSIGSGTAFGGQAALSPGVFGGVVGTTENGGVPGAQSFGGWAENALGGFLGQNARETQTAMQGFMGSPAMSALNMAITAANPVAGAVVGAGRGFATGNPVAGALSLGGLASPALGAIGAINGISGFVGGPTLDSALSSAMNDSTSPTGSTTQGSQQSTQSNGGYSGPSSFSGPSGSGSPLAELLARA